MLDFSNFGKMYLCHTSIIILEQLIPISFLLQIMRNSPQTELSMISQVQKYLFALQNVINIILTQKKMKKDKSE